MNVSFSDQAERDLQLFIHQYEEAFLELYSDTGLHNEDTIIDLYRGSAKRLYEMVINATREHLQDEKVLGRKNITTLRELVFHVDNRLIIVHYSEDKKRKIRHVESISIDRKPIIF